MLHTIKNKLNFERYDQTLYESFNVGDVLKLKDGSLKLVGDVNRELGVCDDCVEFKYTDIIEVANIKDVLSI